MSAAGIGTEVKYIIKFLTVNALKKFHGPCIVDPALKTLQFGTRLVGPALWTLPCGPRPVDPALWTLAPIYVWSVF